MYCGVKILLLKWHTVAQIDTVSDENQCYNKNIAKQCYVFVTLGLTKKLIRYIIITERSMNYESIIRRTNT